MEINTQERITPAAIGIRYGLLVGLVSVIITFGLYATGQEQGPLKWVSTLVLIGGMVMAMNNFKQANGGFMSYGQGLGIGTLVSAVSGVLTAIFVYIYMGFIDPGAIERMMEKARMDMEAKGGLSDEQMEQGLAMAGKFMTPAALTISVLIGSIIMGFIISLVVSAILKRTKPEFE